MNYIPNEKEIEKMLEDSSPNVSPRLDKQLANAPWTPRAVARKRVVRAAFAILALAVVSIAISPQGRVFAQDFISQFFTRTESDTYYSEPSTLTFEDTTSFYTECGIAIFPTCSVEQIRSMVDFEVKEIGAIPEAMYYVGATGGPDFVELKYGYENRWDGNLSVGVEAVGRPSAIGTGITAKSANIQAVQIGDLPGEYYTGVLFQDDQGNVTWQPNDHVMVLRWEDDGSTYTLIYESNTIPLTVEDLIALAASMTTDPVIKKPLPPRFIR
ncbi:MAG TPA: hypothetical protein VJM08_11815 [Anaerolineales bacterium]|nr:hypothetical protein [Anaerolineales bacterium]